MTRSPMRRSRRMMRGRLASSLSMRYSWLRELMRQMILDRFSPVSEDGPSNRLDDDGVLSSLGGSARSMLRRASSSSESSGWPSVEAEDGGGEEEGAAGTRRGSWAARRSRMRSSQGWAKNSEKEMRL